MPQGGPERKSLCQDLIYWLERPGAFGSSPSNSPVADVHMPVQALLYLICGEWLMISEYLNTRLAQVEWEISFPEHFLISGDKIDRSLRKLHIWRRLVPTYLAMLTETLEQVFCFQCHTSSTNANLNLATNVHSASGTNSSEPTSCQCPIHQGTPPSLGPIFTLREDFLRLRASISEYQHRIDRLTGFVTSMIAIDDSHRGLENSRNVTRLTWLATCFIPLSLTASIFSMQEELSTIGQTVKWYFLTGILLVLATIGVAWILTGKAVTSNIKKLRKKKEKKA